MLIIDCNSFVINMTYKEGIIHTSIFNDIDDSKYSSQKDSDISFEEIKNEIDNIQLSSNENI